MPYPTQPGFLSCPFYISHHTSTRQHRREITPALFIQRYRGTPTQTLPPNQYHLLLCLPSPTHVHNPHVTTIYVYRTCYVAGFISAAYKFPALPPLPTTPPPPHLSTGTPFPQTPPRQFSKTLPNGQRHSPTIPPTRVECTCTTYLPSPTSTSTRLHPRIPTSGNEKHWHVQTKDRDLLTSAVLNLTKVIKTNHNDSKEIIINLRQELQAALMTVKTAF